MRNENYNLINTDSIKGIKNITFTLSPMAKHEDYINHIAPKFKNIWGNEKDGCPIGAISYKHSVEFTVLEGTEIVKDPFIRSNKNNFAVQFNCCFNEDKKNMMIKSPRICILNPFGDWSSRFHNRENDKESLIRRVLWHYNNDCYPHTIALDLDNHFIYMVYPELTEDGKLDSLRFEIFAYVDPDDKYKKKFWDSIIPDLDTRGNSGCPFYIGIKEYYLIAYVNKVIGFYHIRQDGIEIVFTHGIDQKSRVSSSGYINCSSGPWAGRW